MADMPLITTSELADRLGDPQLGVVDCRFDLGDTEIGRKNYRAAHIPGAVYAHLDHDLSAPAGPGRHPLPDVDAFAGWLGAMGIDGDTYVVAYDASGGAFSSRLWWMLGSLGHRVVKVLDGGWPAWRAAGLPEERGWPELQSTTYITSHLWTGTVDRREVRSMIGAATLVDARAAERYRGEIEPLDPVAGHIPSARSYPFAASLDEDGRFLTAAALAERFADLNGDIVSYCGSGVTACHNILAMELAGITDVRLYPGSWSDWSTAGETIATGPD